MREPGDVMNIVIFHILSLIDPLYWESVGSYFVIKKEIIYKHIKAF